MIQLILKKISINDSCIIGKLTHEDVGHLIKQMETILKDVICQKVLAIETLITWSQQFLLQLECQ